MTEPVPPLGDSARQLLAAVDSMSILLPERDRIVRALDLLAPDAWTRVCVVLPEGAPGSLRQAGRSFTPDELAHVVEVAGTVARLYGYAFVGIEHLAVALAATAAHVQGEDFSRIDVVAEAFGLGELENSGEIVNQHLLAVESPAQTPSPGWEWGPTTVALRWKRGAVAAHLGVRALAVSLLLVIAAGAGSFWAWPVAVAAAVSSRDSREPEPPLGELVSPAELRLRAPWLGCLAVLAAVLGLHRSAVVIALLPALLTVISCAGEWGAARQVRMAGEEIDRAGPHTRDLLAPVAVYPVRRRVVRGLLLLCLCVVPVTVLSAGLPAQWILFLLIGVFGARRLPGFALFTAALVPATASWTSPGQPLAPLLAGALAALLCGLATWGATAWAERLPTFVVPAARPPLTDLLRRDGRDLLRAHRLLRLGHPASALDRLGPAQPSEPPPVAALRGWALVQNGSPGAARRAVDGHTGRGSAVHELVALYAALELSDRDAAEHALAAIRRVPGPVADRMRPHLLSGWLRLALLRDEGPHLTDHIAELVPRKITRRTLIPALTLLRLAAEAALPRTPHLAYYLAGTAAPLTEEANGYGFKNERWLLGPGRPIGLEMVRSAAVAHLASLTTDGVTPETVGGLGTSGGAAELLMRLDRPIEAAATLSTLADRLGDLPAYRLTALHSRIEALAVLNATRHQLHTTDERQRWWGVFGRAIEQAMEQAAAGRDWATLAELIESARLQLGPRGDGSTFDAAGSAAPFIRVRGTSRLEEAHWYRPQDLPRAFALEDLAVSVLGPGTWWWSTWATDSLVYWALVPPAGPVQGGTFGLEPGSDPASALSDLRDALPVRYPGEEPWDWEDRVLASALLVGPRHDEAALARRLGRLLPAGLVRALRADGPPLHLAIAPAARLANVPWAAVGVPGEDGPDDLRLVERCTMAIAPPAGLLAALSARSRRTEAPALTLALIDPGSDLGEPDPDGELPGARALLEHLPDEVTVLTPSTDVSLDGFGAKLWELRDQGEGSAVIACHTVERVPSPLKGGLVLRPATGADEEDPEAAARVLTAGMLIAEPGRFPMPRQVLMLCCDSGDLGGAVSGEWLVLGTAMLWAGSDRLVVTSYPTVDSAEGQDQDSVIDPLLVRELVGRRPLLDGLREVQLRELAAWRATGTRGAPVHWAGHIAMGAFGPLTPLPHLGPARRRRVSESVIELVDDAAGQPTGAGRRRVTRWDLMVRLGVWGFEEDLPLWRRLAVRAVLYPYLLTSALLRRKGAKDAQVVLGQDVVDTLRDAAAMARASGHHIVDVEHVLVAFLRAPGVPAGCARKVTGWDARKPETHRDLLGEALASEDHTWLPATTHLAPDAVAQVYEALDADMPAPRPPAAQ
ncbi:Clp protease N-terminal domain-containing protein [Streptomyces sp. NPDC060028]|uniref:Clp protease N-terminal domain-containing protein n=1 Tax=Streptomyces sp. NPDC060028 TaxID=3347041 RepID=UPI003692D499